MPGVNRYMNSSGWQFTPLSGTAIPITGVKSAAYDEGISVKKESADFDLFFTVAVVDNRDPKITLETLDAFALFSTASGVRGTVTGVIRDAYSGATTGGGAKQISMTGAAIEGRNMTQAHREYGTQQLTFGSVSSDGSTHPVSISAL